MDNRNYNTNLFKPKTQYARINTRIIIISLLIWAVAVFGFQIALRVMERPVPEKSYVTFSKFWTKIHKGTVTNQDKAELAKVYLTVMGKYEKLRSNNILQKAFTFTLLTIDPGKVNSLSATEARYMLGLSEKSLLAKVIPYALVPAKDSVLSRNEAKQIPVLMKKYLIHNRSVLTDTKFLGFPFHYFYTSVFLLILFVVMCWSYCFIIQKVNTKLGINEDES
ncbi:MAG: DUF4212 domain-containing protein [bacterium]|nr:DUF4212 domain-containing protein [bacterium]